jgi:ABC-type uncharacterized transport system substrate-binding protein
MRRIGLAVVLTLSLLAQHGADAQPTGNVYRVGVLSEGPRSSVIDRMLPPELRALGWVENENFVFERRHAEGRPDQLPELAADLVRAKPDLILAVGNPETAAAKRATSSIPIVMMFGLQPIETGLVPSLARPGGNVTGMVWVTPEYAGKILEVFKEAVPKATTIALDGAFKTLETMRPSGVVVATTLLVHQRRDDVLAFMVKHRLPAFYAGRPFVDAGGLGSYFPQLADHYRRVAAFVDRILRGARPGDIPIEQPTKFELVVNLKTANALGLTIPPSILLRADQVLE